MQRYGKAFEKTNITNFFLKKINQINFHSSYYKYITSKNCKNNEKTILSGYDHVGSTVNECTERQKV